VWLMKIARALALPRAIGFLESITEWVGCIFVSPFPIRFSPVEAMATEGSFPRVLVVGDSSDKTLNARNRISESSDSDQAETHPWKKSGL
jgi:hypothetical protein